MKKKVEPVTLTAYTNRVNWISLCMSFLVVYGFLHNINITSNILPGTTAKNDDEIFEENFIHWKSPNHKSLPTIYYSHQNDGNGIGEIKKLMSDVLPEYRIINLFVGGRNPKIPPEYTEVNYTNPYDVSISIFGQYGLPYWERWLHTHFNGHVVFFSGENDIDHPVKGTTSKTSNLHAFGPIQDSTMRDQDIQLFYFQLIWWFYYRDVLSPSALTLPNYRPRGSESNTFMIYANSNCVPFREEAVGLLSEMGQVHCDGRCQGRTPPSGSRENLTKTKIGGFGHWWDNYKIYSKYRFCFVMEHADNNPGYITEKIMMAYAGGCIPIYYGDKKIFDIFNEKSFVFYNISDPQPALDLVNALERNSDLYEKMTKEPILVNGNTTIEQYFSFNDEVGNGALKKEMRKRLGLSNLSP